jgi:hypothetical protein
MGKVTKTTKANKKMSLTENIRKMEFPQTIANWPTEERQREKLLFKGSQSPSNVELIGIGLEVQSNA